MWDAVNLDYLVQVASEEEVRNLLPDFSRLRWVTSRGIMVTSQGREYDFVSRFFCTGIRN